MKAPSTSSAEHSRHFGNRESPGHGQGSAAVAAPDRRAEMEQQQGLLRLTAGSLRVQRQCSCGSPSAGGGTCTACEAKASGAGSQVLQKKLAIGATDDPLEREADRVADQVLPLDSGVRAMLESGFGLSLANVRVRTDDTAARAADALHARAFTFGSSIWFGAGEYRPDTSDGRRLLAHEVAHTVQQAGGPVGAQTKLTIGRPDDPAERAADTAAAAVLRGERASLAMGAAAAVRLQPKSGTSGTPECISTSTGPKTAMVKCGDREYRVTATPVTERSPATRITATPDIDATDISLDVSICRGGTDVRIKPSVNLPQALRTAIGNAISSNSIGNVTVMPRAQITWLQSEQIDVSLTGGPDIDVSSGRVTGGTVGGAVDTGSVKIGGNVILGPDGRPIGGGITIGSSTKPKAVDCHDKHVVLQLSCESKTTNRGKKPVPGVDPKPVPEQLGIFFEYNSTKIREDELPSRARLNELTAQGAHIVSIDGFASPEGPRKRVPGFIGNNQLSADRAVAAEAWLRENAPQLIPPTYNKNSTVGQGEIGPPDTNGREPAVSAQDVTYPSLRKATIHLTRVIPGTPSQPATPDTYTYDSVYCPDDVKRAARKVLRKP